ncbi:uncharacterized protein LOC135378410 isoform X1 [Ornithodoros turicata]|uniref:uncharacterized protein LOC135378410 isoform X1 n=1 Tax=Ornithodoros turicata TaxID=34597 RepID=UPI00313955BD
MATIRIARTWEVLSFEECPQTEAFSCRAQFVEIFLAKSVGVLPFKELRRMLSTISSLVAVASDSLQQLVSQSSTRATSNPSSLKRYTLDDVAQHCFHDDCWLVVHNRVYDVTSFITQHPGGEEIIWEHAGRDATLAFTGAGHSQDAVVILNKYIIGVLVEEEHVNIISDMGFQMAVCTES